jgi:gamma-glutamylcyclotransferase (GGCT)/AIG2-like uncharacterized protein YtfP
MIKELNINDDVKVLKLEILKENLKQDWNLDTDLWNEEFPHDYRFEDTYLQLSFILRDFNIDELKHLISITNIFDIKNYNHDIATLINNFVRSCVDYLNHEIEGKSEEYFKKFDKNNNCFSYEKKIKIALKKHKLKYSLFFYGTLRAEEVRNAVIGKKKYDICEGFLQKHKVYKVKNANYPLIQFTNIKSDKVQGILITDLTAEEIEKLDKFEGTNYFRQFVKINIEDKLHDAQIYMPKKILIADIPWDFDYWYKNNMKDFFSKEFNLNGVK